MIDPALRIVFAGTPEFAATALQALIDHGHNLVAVYSQPDRPAGRGQKARPSPVKAVAEQHGLSIEQPENFRSEEAMARLAAYQPDIMVVAAYGLILPVRVLQTPRLGCINIHASLLPAWRGAAPIQRAIEAGDDESGVTIMQMEKGLDTGPMLLKRVTPITAQDTGGSLHDRLASLGAEALLESLPAIQCQTLQPEPQDHDKASYAHKLTKEEASINWSDSAELIARRIRAFNPWPVCQTRLQGKVIKIWAAHVKDHVHLSPPGTLLKASPGCIWVACGEQSTLSLDEMQLPGGRPLSTQALLNGHSALFAPNGTFEFQV
ncbi:MAG: methionyl-tRNA formyltransferase [Hahellaceae bacterium]|nr:methionyl-tRNA formyltransferase [Hahellaceae bacterium]